MITNPAIVRELQRLADETDDGVLKPEAVVEAAAEETSPLHGQFTWDDSEAAQKYRLWQARTLLRVVVRYEQISPEKRVPCRVFVSLSPDREADGGGYRVATTVLSDEAMRDQLLQDARREMLGFKAKYAHLNELARVFEAIDEAVAMTEPDMASA